MRKNLALKTFLLCAVLLISAFAFAQEPIVNAIEIRGLRKIEEGALKRRISQQVGLSLSPEGVTSDIKSIYETGYFEDVKVDAEAFEGGIKLIYIVKEKPSVVRIEFSGNAKIASSKLLEQITISRGSVADPVLINDNAIKLRLFYEKEGYSLLEVIPVLNAISEAEVTLTYVIKEGPKIKIKKIKFEGNKAISSRKIKKAVKSSEKGILSFITKGGYYRKAELASDTDLIKELYFDNGYIQAMVSEPEVEVSADKKWAVVTFRITEGEQFRVSEIDFSGNKAYASGELKKLLQTKPGKPISRRQVRKDVANLTEKFAEKGYAAAGIDPELIPDVSKKQVGILFHVEEGDIYSIGRVEITGNQKTRDKVIRREVLLNEGDTFNGRLLKKSYQRINNLNYFESVSLQPQPIPDKKLVNLNIDVKERATGLLSVGGGYSSVDKLIGMVDVTQANLGGRGQYLKLKAELGGRSTFYELNFREPWLFGKRLTLSTSIYRQKREFLEYNRTSTGFELGLGKGLGENWWASSTYRIERATIDEILDTASDAIKEQEGTRTTSSITPGIVRDTRDNFLDPGTGSRNSLFVTFAGLGGENRFLKLNLNSSWFFPVGSSTIALHGTYGHATGIFGKPLPLYERYYVGGIYTLRGLGYGDAGPKDDNGKAIGGKKQVVFNLDYIFPLIPEARLKGVTFFDAGTAYDDSPSDIRYTAGLGIRWISPIGPIRLEWGKNLNKKPGEKASRFEFAFGTFF